MVSPFFGEFIGTLVLILLGDGVVAGVLLKRSKAEGSGWIVITAGWAFAVMAGVFAAWRHNWLCHQSRTRSWSANRSRGSAHCRERKIRLEVCRHSRVRTIDWCGDCRHVDPARALLAVSPWGNAPGLIVPDSLRPSSQPVNQQSQVGLRY